ncbi:MAG: hypothetical protein EOP53_27640 [Sphingobacteriales bacterium]|nr:MAG: hypothetical protein EOP53_27640 [Sphingobacteriales bacterium]
MQEIIISRQQLKILLAKQKERTMKKLAALLAILSMSIAQAQIKVKINGKPLAENATVKAEDIKTFDVSFTNPKKLSYIGSGRAIFGVALLSPKNQLIEEYIIKKDGINGVESLLADVNVFLNVIADANGETQFKPRVLDHPFLEMLGRDDDETIKIEINLMFFDKIGYEKYGEPVVLVKKFVFMIDNKSNAVAYVQKQQEQKAKEDAAEAERDKARMAEKLEAEAKKKKKGVLGSLLNKIN